MDPKKSLSNQLETATRLLAAIDSEDTVAEDLEDILEDAALLAQAVLDLNEWRRKGGFSPYTAQERITTSNE